MPQLTVHRPAPEKDTGAAVLVCPGGGYHILAMDLEGTEIVEWLNSIGVTGHPLEVSCFRSGKIVPITRRLYRMRSGRWGWCDKMRRNGESIPSESASMGFSAGGHLSAALSCNYDKRNYAPIDAAGPIELSSRDFVLLVYPAYLTVEKNGSHDFLRAEDNGEGLHRLLSFKRRDDGIPVETSVYYYAALKKAGVPVEMHLYPKGGTRFTD